MRLSFELPDELIDRIADALAARVKPSPGAGPLLLGPRDVGVSPRTWRAAIKSGELAALKVGRELRATRGDVDKWLACLQITPTEGTDESDPDGDELDQLLAAGTLRSIRGGRS